MYLAEQVLNEQRTVCVMPTLFSVAATDRYQVTYRSLSRALKVHANRAKQYAVPMILGRQMAN